MWKETEILADPFQVPYIMEQIACLEQVFIGLIKIMKNDIAQRIKPLQAFVLARQLPV